jgi:hypothetical protein
LSLPEIKDADPDGWLRTTFTRKVVGADNDGISIESYRNGSLVLTGWIVPTVQGIANSRLKSSDDDYRLQPLDIFVAMPDKNFHKSWQTHDKTGTASDHQYEMWGPLPIKTADGEKPGYVVIQKEPNPKQKSVIGATAAYEIVPDVGLVREVDSRIAPSGQTISRIELTLTAMHAGSGDEPQLRSLTVPAPPANQPSGAQNERANQQQILNDLLR